jgi:hypothetical protein
LSTPKTPLAKALVSGAAAKNPQRYRIAGRDWWPGPVGDPDARMTDAQKDAWRDFTGELPWLNRSHRAVLRLACTLRARIETADEPGVNLLSAYSSVLSKLGATPGDEGKVRQPEVDDDDPAERFFQ